MGRRKRKKGPKTKKQIVSQLIVGLIIFSLLVMILSVTEPGCALYQKLLSKYPQKSWSPWLQLKVAKMHHFWGRGQAASTAFELYCKNYPKEPEEDILHARYWQLSALRDARQYATCLRKIEIFFDDYYEDYDTEDPLVSKYYERAKVLKQNIMSITPSKRIDQQ